MSKEKQMIEELADFLWRNTLIHTEDLCHDVAETIITEGYRQEGRASMKKLPCGWLFRLTRFCKNRKCETCILRNK